MIDKKDEYITPINEVSFYDVINDELKQKLLDIHGENSTANNMFEVLEEDLTDLKLNDINGNTIDFNSLKDKEFILEIVQNTCEHCKKQVPLTETILKNEDVIILKNHGVIATGKTVEEAAALVEFTEEIAKTQFVTHMLNKI